jgi:hypothetical protein
MTTIHPVMNKDLADLDEIGGCGRLPRIIENRGFVGLNRHTDADRLGKDQKITSLSQASDGSP